MIKLKLEFATGEECRNALVALLGGDLSVIEQKPQIAIKDEKIAENFSAPKMEVVEDEKPAEVSASTKKRRTKAEIEAANAENTAARSEVDETVEQKDIQTDAAPKEEAKESAVTATMLQEKAVNLIRNGKKELVVAIIKKFGGDSISQADKNPLKPEVYAEVMDELNKL